MKVLFLMIGLVIISCSHRQIKESEVLTKQSGDGTISASARKYTLDQNLCFEIEIRSSNGTSREVSSAGWSVVWLDKNSRYHLLPLTQRSPASIPQSSGSIWKNIFRTCAPLNKLGEWGSLIFTPKFSPQAGEEIHFIWK